MWHKLYPKHLRTSSKNNANRRLFFNLLTTNSNRYLWSVVGLCSIKIIGNKVIVWKETQIKVKIQLIFFSAIVHFVDVVWQFIFDCLPTLG